MRNFLLALLLILHSGLIAQALAKTKNKSKSGLEAHKSKLERLENEIKQKEKEVSKLVRKETSILGELEQLDRKIDAARQKRSALEHERQQLEKQLVHQGADLMVLEERSRKLEMQSQERLRGLQRMGDGGIMRLLLALDDWRDLSDLARLIKRLVQTDLYLLKTSRQQQKDLLNQREALQANRAKLKGLLSGVEEQNREILEKRSHQKSLLKLTRNQRDFNARSLEELRNAANNLQSLVDKLSREGFRSAFGTMKGILPLPVEASIQGQFGRAFEPRFKTWINRNGVEFNAKSGQEVKAIYAGKVIYAGWFTGYGKIVIVDHGDTYYTMSAHLDRLLKQVGDKVDAGEAIATAGDTGSLKGPLLYFELRQRGQAINPSPWFDPTLVKRRGR